MCRFSEILWDKRAWIGYVYMIFAYFVVCWASVLQQLSDGLRDTDVCGIFDPLCTLVRLLFQSGYFGKTHIVTKSTRLTKCR